MDPDQTVLRIKLTRVHIVCFHNLVQGALEYMQQTSKVDDIFRTKT